MSAPVLNPPPGPTLARLYWRLPEHYLLADQRLGYPLYRWLAGIGAEAGKVEELVARIDYVTRNDGGAAGDTSDLTDPVTADLRWLPWLAQLVGVTLRDDLTDLERRDAVRFASSGWRAGTKTAVAAAAKSELTGERRSRVYDHSSTARPQGSLGTAGPWDVLIVTRNSETPSGAAVVQAVIRKDAKPAGVMLHHEAFEATWGDIHRTLPTWGDWRGKTWQQVQETGI